VPSEASTTRSASGNAAGSTRAGSGPRGGGGVQACDTPVAAALRPHLLDTATLGVGQQLLEAIDSEIPAVFAALPSLPASPTMPPASEFAGVLAALDTYRKTSPEMVVFGRMIGESLPAAE